MALEGSARREFSQFMSNHILRDKDRDEPLPVVHGYRQSDHFGDDRRLARPSLYDLSLSPLRGQLIHSFQQFVFDKRPFLQRSAHGYLLLLRTMYLSVLLFLLVLYPFVGCPQGETGFRPPFAFPSPPP